MKLHIIMKCDAETMINFGSTDARQRIAMNNLHKKDTASACLGLSIYHTYDISIILAGNLRKN